MSVSWEEAFGPLYSLSEAAHILGMSPELLEDLTSRREALRLEDGSFPGWQFDLENLKVYPAVIEIMKIFRDRNLEEIDVASFCVSPSDEISDDVLVIPLDLFDEGMPSKLLTAAKRDASRLSD